MFAGPDPTTFRPGTAAPRPHHGTRPAPRTPQCPGPDSAVTTSRTVPHAPFQDVSPSLRSADPKRLVLRALDEGLRGLLLIPARSHRPAQAVTADHSASTELCHASFPFPPHPAHHKPSVPKPTLPFTFSIPACRQPRHLLQCVRRAGRRSRPGRARLRQPGTLSGLPTSLTLIHKRRAPGPCRQGAATPPARRLPLPLAALMACPALTGGPSASRTPDFGGGRRRPRARLGWALHACRTWLRTYPPCRGTADPAPLARPRRRTACSPPPGRGPRPRMTLFLCRPGTEETTPSRPASP